MPFPLETLLDGRPQPVTITADGTVIDALLLMTEHDFSQLPVVDPDGHLLGAVTVNSILRIVHFSDTTVAKLCVRDVKTSAPTCSIEDELFDVVDQLTTASFLAVVDGDGKVTGILTDFDIAAFFRSRAEDMMLVEDIEVILRSFVAAAFPAARQTPNDPEFVEAVRQSRVRDIDQKQFNKALSRFLTLADHKDIKLDRHTTGDAFSVLLEKQRQPTGLDDLTFAELVGLFFLDKLWAKYRQAINMEKSSVSTMLDQVRVVRNKIAHFKGAVTGIEHTVLTVCLDWLLNHQDGVLAVFASDDSRVGTDNGHLPHSSTNGMTASGVQSGKYSPITAWLQTHTSNGIGLQVGFDTIEQVIGGKLPESAAKHVSWWANDSKSHPQSRAWLLAHWRVRSVSLGHKLVYFEPDRVQSMTVIPVDRSLLDNATTWNYPATTDSSAKVEDSHMEEKN